MDTNEIKLKSECMAQTMPLVQIKGLEQKMNKSGTSNLETFIVGVQQHGACMQLVRY